LGEPVVLRGADALARAGDEIPRHEPVAERVAADEDDAAAARRRQRRRRPGSQDDHRALVVLDAVDLDRVVEGVERALARICRGERNRRLRRHVEIDDHRQRRRCGFDRRAGAEGGAGDDAGGGAGEADARNALGRHVLERRRRVLERFRQRDPELQAVAAVRPADEILGRALRVDDAAPRRHPVDGAGLDPLDHAGRVAVHDGALEEIGERRQADVRMRPDVVVRARLDVDRPEVVEEDERPDRTPRRRREQAANHQAAAEVARLRRESLQLGHGWPSGRWSDPV